MYGSVTKWNRPGGPCSVGWELLLSLEMPTSEKMFSLAETRGSSPTEADLTFRVATGELASVEQYCLTPSVVDFWKF